MAPHALTDLNDTSGYYPSKSHKVCSRPIRCHNNGLAEPRANAKIPLDKLGFGSESPKNVWNLSSDEIAEIEKNVRYFLSMCACRLTMYIL